MAAQSAIRQRIISLQNVKIKRMSRIVERESKRTDGIDVSVELEHCLLSVKHRELHSISTYFFLRLKTQVWTIKINFNLKYIHGR